jgi:hypothetical protein
MDKVVEKNPKIFSMLRQIEYEHSTEISRKLISESFKAYGKSPSVSSVARGFKKMDMKFLKFLYISSLIFITFS